MNKEQIVIYSHAAGSPEIGPNIRVYNIAKVLVQKGYDVSVVASGYFHKYNESQVSGFVNRRRIDNIDYAYLWNIRYNNRVFHLINLFLYSLFSTIAAVVWYRKCKKVIISNPPLVPLGPLLLHKISGSQRFLDIRDQWPEILTDLKDSLPVRVYSKILSYKKKFLIRMSNKVIVVKEGEVDYMTYTYGLKRSDIIYLPNGILFKNDGINLTDELGCIEEQNEKRRIVYIGSLNFYYKIIEFCDLVKDFLELEFHIYGDGNQKNKIEEITRVYSNIFYHGRIPPEEVGPVLSTYDVAYNGLQDSQMNRYGISTNKLFDYLLRGLPVISFCHSDYDPVRLSGGGFGANDDEEVVEVLKRVQDMPINELKEMGRRGRDYLFTHHDFHKNIETLISHLS